MIQQMSTDKGRQLAVALVLVTAAWLILGCREANISKDKIQTGFREAADASGIKFRMVFLPKEQVADEGFKLYDHGSGIAVGDFDGDGHEDIYFCNQLGRNALYRNKGDGTFEDVTEIAGVGMGDRISVAAAFADYDNDGKLDLYVTSTCGGNVLFRNMGDGTFKDVTKESGLGHESGLGLVAHSQTAVFFDYDNDGYVDLFVTNTAKWSAEDRNKVIGKILPAEDFLQAAGYRKEHNILYRNVPDGKGGRHFDDVTEKAGLKGKGWAGDVAVFDYDHDGHLDLFVTNMFGTSQLYRNNGDGTFTDVTKEVLGRTSWGAVGCKVFDFNNDGRLDLLVVDMHSDMWTSPKQWSDPQVPGFDPKKKFPSVLGPLAGQLPAAKAIETRLAARFGIRHDDVIFGNTLFKQLANGKFQEVSDKANLETWWPWGIATGDFDNNGYEDVFLPSGRGYPHCYWPNALLMNNGNETFIDRADALGIEPPPNGPYLDKTIARSSRSAVVADFDGDGRLDLVVNNFNDRAYYFRNNLPKKNYVAFRLRGTKSNRDAIGAVVTLHMGNEVMARQVSPGGGHLSQSSRTIHFGLGDRAKIDTAEIRWPSGLLQRIDAPAINRLHIIIEPRT